MNLLITVLIAQSSFFVSQAQIGFAPFCVQTTGMKRCYYYSVSACTAAAAAYNGICVPR